MNPDRFPAELGGMDGQGAQLPLTADSRLASERELAVEMQGSQALPCCRPSCSLGAERAVAWALVVRPPEARKGSVPPVDGGGTVSHATQRAVRQRQAS